MAKTRTTKKGTAKKAPAKKRAAKKKAAKKAPAKKARDREQKVARTLSGWARNLTELAAMLGISRAMINKHRANGMPLERSERGYRIEPIVHWIRAHVRLKIDGKPMPPAESDRVSAAKIAKARRRATGDERNIEDLKRELLEVRIDRERATARLKELELAIETGELVAKSKIRERDIARIAVVRRGLLQQANRVGAEGAGMSVRDLSALVRRKNRELIESFASM